VEDDFWTDKERVVRISELLIKEGLDKIVWGASARVDQIVGTEPEILNLARRAGCRSITMGFESGSPRMLEELKKGFTIEQAHEAIRLIKKAGIIVHGNIIVGGPGETLRDAELSREFLKKTSIVTPEIYIFTPYPGSQVWCRLEAEQKIDRKFDWRRFNQEELIMNLSNIPTKALNKLRSKMYLSYYLSHPVYALKFILSALKHPVSTADKLVHTLKPVFKL